MACVVAHNLCKTYITLVTESTFARWASLTFRFAHSSWSWILVWTTHTVRIWLHPLSVLAHSAFADNIGGAWLDFRLPAPYCPPTRLSARHDKEVRQGAGLRPSWPLNLHIALRCWQADLAKVGGGLGPDFPFLDSTKGLVTCHCDGPAIHLAAPLTSRLIDVM